MPLAVTYDFDRALSACATAVPGREPALTLPGVESLATLARDPASGEPYGRRVLHRSAHGEVLLVRFREDTFCAPHDHGAARAVICVLQGNVTEQRFTFDGARLHATLQNAVSATQQLHVPEQTIHRTKGHGGALSLHFYVPAISGMRIYDEAARRTLVVHDDCGAWIPDDDALVTARQPWQ